MSHMKNVPTHTSKHACVHISKDEKENTWNQRFNHNVNKQIEERKKQLIPKKKPVTR